MESTPNVDGGWAWIVLCASYFNIFLCSGLGYLAGVFQLVFLEQFDGSVALTSWVTSMFSSLMQLAGPLSSAISNTLGCRTSVMLGGCLTAVGLFISGLTNDLGVLLFSFGILAGTGLGLIYTSSIVVISFYFDKRRRVVNGVALSAGGLGFILAPQATLGLFEYFSWRESLTILAGIAANACVSGALMFSIHEKISHNKYNAAKLFCRKNSACFTRNRNECECDSVNAVTRYDVVEERELKDMIDNEGGDNQIAVVSESTGIHSENGSIRGSEHIKTRIPEAPRIDNGVEEKCDGSESKTSLTVSELDDETQESGKLFVSKYYLEMSTLKSGKDEAQTTDSDIRQTLLPLTTEHQNETLSEKSQSSSVYHLENNKSNLIDSVKLTQQPNNFNNDFERLKLISPISSSTSQQCSREHFGAGSFDSLNENQSTDSSNSNPYNERIATYSTIKQSPPRPLESCHGSALDKDIRSSDGNERNNGKRFPKLYKNRLFWVLCTSLFVSNAGCGVFNIHVPSFLKSVGLSQKEVTNVLSMNGLAILLGRCLVGALANSLPGNDLMLFMTMHIIGGLIMCMMPVLGTSFLSNMLIIFGIGSYAGTVYAVLPSLTIQLVGLDCLATAFGIEMVSAGVGYLVSPPLAGLLVDLTGSYDYNILCGGLLFIIAGLILKVIPGMKNFSQGNVETQ